MGFTLEKIVPWGRSYEEYVAMFALAEEDLKKRFVGCGDGPANFNCVLTREGGRVVSADPLYEFSCDEIRNRIDGTFDEIMKQTERNKEEFVWERISSVEELGRIRMAAMENFLADYAAGVRDGRYVAASLPVLPFKESEFDIALCSHLLFLYSEQLSAGFHIGSIEELCRVALEARIFPLLELGTRKSRHLETVIRELEKKGFECRVENVAYEFQKGGNEMLRVRASR